jgi:hypothetical protein
MLIALDPKTGMPCSPSCRGRIPSAVCLHAWLCAMNGYRAFTAMMAFAYCVPRRVRVPCWVAAGSCGRADGGADRSSHSGYARRRTRWEQRDKE